MSSVLVGLLDGGAAARHAAAVAAARVFRRTPGGDVMAAGVGSTDSRHGAAIADIVLAAAPQARLLDAQVFSAAGFAAPVVIAAGLDWLVAQGARVVNMSFGLRDDRVPLAAACRRALAAGVVLVAAAPAQGGPVFPAGYPGVVGATGDGRCTDGAISVLRSAGAAAPPADYGASPRVPAVLGALAGAPSGASIAAARITAEIAAYLAAAPQAGLAAVHEHLCARAHRPVARRVV